MKHHIIVKYTREVADKEAMLERIKNLFSNAAPICGVHSYSFYTNCVDRENRYDLMIVIELDSDCLLYWDESPLHKAWLSCFCRYVAQKAIFDC